MMWEYYLSYWRDIVSYLGDICLLILRDTSRKIPPTTIVFCTKRYGVLKGRKDQNQIPPPHFKASPRDGGALFFSKETGEDEFTGPGWKAPSWGDFESGPGPMPSLVVGYSFRFSLSLSRDSHFLPARETISRFHPCRREGWERGRENGTSHYSHQSYAGVTLEKIPCGSPGDSPGVRA